MPSNWIEQESIGFPLDEDQPLFIQNDMYLCDNNLRIASPCQGKLIWKIPNYASRKQGAIEGRKLSIYSQPFYTSFYGYKMCARVYLNDGIGIGRHRKGHSLIALLRSYAWRLWRSPEVAIPLQDHIRPARPIRTHSKAKTHHGYISSGSNEQVFPATGNENEQTKWMSALLCACAGWKRGLLERGHDLHRHTNWERE